MRDFINLLKNNENFRILSTVQLICYFGAWFSHTGIFTLLIELKAPVWAITLCAAMAFIPGVVLAPFSGVLIDRIRPKSLLMGALLIETFSVLLLVFIDDIKLLWLLVGLIFIRMGVAGVSFQTQMSLLPRILSKSELKLANEIHSIIWAVSYTAGMSLAGVYIHFFGIVSAFLFDFALFLLAFFILLRLKADIEASHKSERALAMLKSGLSYLRQNPLVLNLILLHSFVGLTAYDTLVALLAEYKYAAVISIPLAIGFTNGVRAVALMISPAILSRFTNNSTLVFLYLGQGVGIVLWALFQFDFYAAFIGLFVAGFFTSTLWSYTYTLIQTHTDERFYGRVVAYTDMIFLSVGSLTSFVIGWLFDAGFSLSLITAILGVLFFVGAVYLLWVKRAFKLS
ncbi:MFS transporter [Campylobacter sp. 19-13652]|uniref:MFS transporter n=1 Tax=Campylobacter sp. 19-13652 TaxID=2840180 RepID=UPI001C76B6EE|nr:MFS transporter [Campylobacter sp. 19-13652]BCX79656.1 MFS transporter [Campylobacter sp. 19-13652]